MDQKKKVIPFSQGEEAIISDIIDVLRSGGHPEDAENVQNIKTALEELAVSISRYPSILEAHRLVGEGRTIDSLVESLCQKEVPDMIMRIPSKAVLGRAYSISKLNFLFMLSYIVERMPQIGHYAKTIHQLISNNVFVIMNEEVFLYIIEDMAISKHIRSNAAYLLARTWELRLEDGVPEFAPILQKLWRARGKMVPNFGTMLGFSELFLLSGDTESRWYDFLLRDDLDEDEIYSLQEFIFGLTYEEIGLLRARMEKAKRTSVGRDELADYLDKKKAYPEYEMDDPRDLYRSFRDRKNHGRYRKRARLEGPKKTFEEYLMCFLLTQPEIERADVM